jgi:hypothetical protein
MLNVSIRKLKLNLILKQLESKKKIKFYCGRRKKVKLIKATKNNLRLYKKYVRTSKLE